MVGKTVAHFLSLTRPFGLLKLSATLPTSSKVGVYLPIPCGVPAPRAPVQERELAGHLVKPLCSPLQYPYQVPTPAPTLKPTFEASSEVHPSNLSGFGLRRYLLYKGEPGSQVTSVIQVLRTQASLRRLLGLDLVGSRESADPTLASLAQGLASSKLGFRVQLYPTITRRWMT